MARFAGRLVVRIYLFGVAALVLLSGVALVLARLNADTAPREGQVARSAYLVNQVAEHWGDLPAMQRELDQVREAYRSSLSFYTLEGALLVATGTPPLAPLAAPELARLREAGTGPQAVVLRDEGCGAPACELALPVHRGGQLVGYGVVQPWRPPFPAHGLLIPLGVALLAFALAALLAARSLARPLSRIAQVARSFGQGDLSARTGLRRKDELGEVAQAFDEMAERLQALLRAQTELLANVSHELRTPLSRIRVAMELASEAQGPLTEDFLQEVGKDLEELEQLVTEILATARLDLAHGRATGTQPLQRSLTPVGALLQSAADTLRARHPQRPVELKVETGLPDLEVDGVLLRRAVGNLLSNAHKYSDAGLPIQLRARSEDGEVVVSVEDRGIGLSAEDRAKLFTPFFRSDRSRNRGTGGVGLGLTLTKRIVEAHGGHVEVRSEVGQGSTFTVRLPSPSGRGPG